MIEVDGTKGYKLQNTSDMQEKIVDKELNFKLTEEDFAEKGKEAGRLAGELNKLNIEFDAVKKQWKEKLNEKEAELSKVLGTIRRGDEDRMVKCVMRKDFTRHVVQYLFNGDVMHEREMKMDERQMELVKDDKKKSNAESKESMEAQLEALPKDDKKREIAAVIREETNKKTAKDMSH